MEKEKKIGEWKELMIKEFTDIFNKDKNMYLSNFTGLKSEEMNELRRSLESSSAKYIVVKNSIAKVVLENAGLSDLVKMLNGGIGITLGGKDPINTAKTLARFGKGHTSLKTLGGYLDGELIDATRMKFLASLPSRQELIAKTVYGIKAPLSGFVGVLSNTLKKFVYVVQAIKEKQGG